MRTRIVTEPRFEAETTALLARLGPASPISDYGTLLAARAEPADPALTGRSDPAVRVADLYLPARHGPLGVRWYRHHAAASPGPVLLWLHGGGFIGGAVADIDHVCCGLARHAGLTVVSLGYRLAPEHAYPAALLDTCDALRWLADHGDIRLRPGLAAGHRASHGNVAGSWQSGRHAQKGAP